MKQKLWTSLKSVLGFDDASLVMPASFDTRIADQNQQFHDFCHKVVERVMELKGSPAAMAASTLILKNSELHRQKGITIRSAQSILDHGIDPGFTFATVFLTNPFLVKKHKINVRRYLVAVCTGGRLRAYVHDDGKSIYTKVPYQEPWNIAMSPDQRWDDLSLGSEVMQNRLDEMITTGYVDDSMYDDKPLSVRDFLQYLRDRNIDTSLLQKSMFIRLALSVYVSVADEGFDLCAMHKDELNPPNTNLPFHLTAQPVPECLQQSIRFQHFGCDFHIDESLTGANAKLFECNKVNTS